MPWLETSPVEQRKEFIAALVRREHSFTETCRRFRISRKNGYKWWNRYLIEQAAGDKLYENRSRRPHRSPNAIAPELEAAIVELRKQRPYWGPKKLLALLAKADASMKLPSESTVAAVLKRNGLVRPRRKRSRSTPYTAPLAHASRPNAVWSIDFKGDFAIGRTRCYPLTITDSYSRYIIACVALTSTRSGPVRRALGDVFDEYGLPDAIRTDNGSPFSSKGLAGLSQLSVWWYRLGIRHERIEPAHPEQNGRHERMHRDLKRETTCPPAKTLGGQQRLFDQFRARFNFERPHEALGQRTPADFYERSLRSLPEPPWGRDFEYEADDDSARVTKLGYVRTHRGAFFLSTTLADQIVLLDWIEASRAQIWFRDLLLGEIRTERKRRRVRFIPVDVVRPIQRSPKVSPMSLDKPPF